VLGGGITKNPEKWLQYLQPRTPIVLALINNAGIVGAADYAARSRPCAAGPPHEPVPDEGSRGKNLEHSKNPEPGPSNSSASRAALVDRGPIRS
jgi:hypothetical protein